MYDLIIIGGGPAGLSAGIYAARYALKTLIIEQEYFSGGQLLKTEIVENYPGFEQPISAQKLAQLMENQTRSFGVDIVHESVQQVSLKQRSKEIVTDKNTYHASVVIIATGAQPRMLNIPGEKEYYGRGVSYCATCDAPFFKDKFVAVVGGGNTAVEEAIYLTKYAKKVYIIHRRNALRADTMIQNKAFNNSKIHIIWDSIVASIHFENLHKKHLVLKNKKTNIESPLAVDGLFVFIGYTANTQLFTKDVSLTTDGMIAQTERAGYTNIPGVFVAGDVREKEFRQIITAASDGAYAAYAAHKYLAEQIKE